ncbi:TagK domain-containing protein [Paraburkholderia sp. Tr-20389]|uniref:TagK domain-containing protein n=1 Tax=Paraburkholderia sp. Tr-20389 TaxID=2703903 RepID=UPI00197DE802|nr:TagK domain-containing protein [Paraburkholderia sp. Tr-20389]MBN3752374.1 TagK domain-containing protein [Paraburkholderia sp. Tr-20389]
MEDTTAAPISPQPSSPDGDELIQSLHAYYCEALKSPHRMSTGMGDGMHIAAAHAAASAEPTIDTSRTPDDGLGVLNAHGQRLDDLIDRLVPGGAPGHSEPAFEGPFEILSLFELREPHLDETLRPWPVPPELARSEHHAPAIDSPMQKPVHALHRWD